jgi:hypothetical protein
MRRLWLGGYEPLSSGRRALTSGLVFAGFPIRQLAVRSGSASLG